MRERLAFLTAAAASTLVLVVSFLLALALGTGAGAADPGGASDVGERDDIRFVRGRQLFFAEGCAGCHSVGGEGNPLGPLDGVATRRSRDELRDFAFGTGAAAESLPRRIALTKSAYAELSAEDREAIVAFLESLH
jgi:mono/diheme cytochrome c family protein